MIEGKYRAIAVDPPWRFAEWGGGYGLAATHYPTMSLEEMKRGIPIPELADKDCALFMWVVDSHMDQAMELAKFWGFTFRTCAFVWVKTRREEYAPPMGMGHWTRKGCEQMWLFGKGSPKRKSKAVEQMIYCKKGAHSAKPEEYYERIEALVDGPYLEVCARRTRPGWSSWGNQVGIRDGALL